MATTQLTPDFIQLVFPHAINQEFLLSSLSDKDKSQVDLEKWLKTTTKSSFKGFLINGKREVALVALKGSIFRTYLTNIGLKELNDPSSPDQPYWCQYLRWNVYFFESDESKKKSVEKETGSIQLGHKMPSFYLDKEKDVFFALLPIDVEVNPESLSTTTSSSIQIGIRLYYDLDLSREHVFNYKETNSLVSYLIQVQSKSKPKTAEHLAYIARPIDIKPCLSIQSSFTKAESDILIRIFIRNEIRQYPTETFQENTLLSKYLEDRPEIAQSEIELFDLYTGSLGSFQLKFESSLNQGRRKLSHKVRTRRF